MKQAFARAFDIEIDHYVLIGFTGVIKLVQGGRRRRRHARRAVLRPVLLGQRPHARLGPAGGQEPSERGGRADLRAQPQGRQRLPARQAAAAAGDGGRGQGPQARPRRPAEAAQHRRETVRTDLPLDRAADLFALYSTVDLDKAERAVFGPRRFAVRAGGTDYTLVLDLCRKWITNHFPPERPFGAWTASTS